MTQPISLSQTEKAQQELRELILAGELNPGARISELWLVERLSVSRTPVRAALQRCHAEGLLAEHPNGGYVVRQFTPDDILDAIELRGTLEGLAARLAAERGVSSALLSAMQQAVDEIDQCLALEDSPHLFSTFVLNNAKFHDALHRATPSHLIAEQLAKAASLPFASPSAFVRVQAGGTAGRDMIVLANAQHRALLEAIRHREGSRAEALMREHARIAKQNLRLALNDGKMMQAVKGNRLIQLVQA